MTQGHEPGVSCAPDAWLQQHARNVYSQCGEDGILEKVMEVIGNPDRWCVEFGAWDGRKFSNTRNFIESRGYSAVLIEGDPARYRDLEREFRAYKGVIPLQKFVGITPQDRLDVLLRDTAIPRDFDLLSIDIDGNDYHVWKAFQGYQPKVVIIEYNPTIPTPVEFVQPPDMRVTQGCSLLSLVHLAREKEYELVAATHLNAVFVHRKYLDLFSIHDNSPEALRTDTGAVTYIFCGYDGRVFVRGGGKLPWHGVSYRESRMQVLPWWARIYPGSPGSLRAALVRLYCKVRRALPL